MNRHASKPPKADTWSDRLSASVGARIAAARVGAGLSAQEVSELLAALKHPISRASLSLIETGQRGVSLADVLAIAHVLDQVPMALVAGLDGEVEALPDRRVDAVSFANWAMGNRPLPGNDLAPSGWNDPDDAGDYIHVDPPSYILWRARLALDRRLWDLAMAGSDLEAQMLGQPRDAADSDTVFLWSVRLEQASVAARSALLEVRAQYKTCIEAGLSLRPLPPWVAEVETWIDVALQRSRRVGHSTLDAAGDWYRSSRDDIERGK